MRRVFFEELTLTVTFTDFNAHVQEHMLITLGLSHLQILTHMYEQKHVHYTWAVTYVTDRF